MLVANIGLTGLPRNTRIGQNVLISQKIMTTENVRIFLFERICPYADMPGRFTSPELFEKLLIYLSNNYSVITLEEYFFKERLKLPKKPVILTFDGYYRDFLEYGLPLLNKYDMPATIFVSPECMDKNMPPWNSLIDFLFSKTVKLAISESILKTDYKIKASWESPQARLKYAKQLKMHLQSVKANERWQIIDFYISQFSDVVIPNNILMNWEDIMFLKAQGMEIGVHVITESLPVSNKDDEQLDLILRNSAIRIKEETGNTPSSVSFSTKRNNSRIKNLIHRTGYKLGLAVGQNIYVKEKFGRYSLPRIEIFNESFLMTRLRMNGTIAKLRGLIGK